jgi:hypothetical protein
MLQAKDSTRRADSKDFRCIYCDSPEHVKRDCDELTAALNARKVKLVQGRICSPEGVTNHTGMAGMTDRDKTDRTGRTDRAELDRSSSIV